MTHLLIPRRVSQEEARTPVDAWYDDQREMEDRILEKGIDGLWEIAGARHEAGYTRGERMAEWCLLGIFFADTVGNFSPITQGAPADTCAARPDPVIPAFQMKALTNEWIITFRPCLPPSGAVCERCGGGWSLDNIRDLFIDGDIVRHESCHQRYVVERETEEMRALFEKAEIPFDKMEEIPNGYSHRPNYYGPWFLFHTTSGIIKIGWRKRVINIDWSQSTLTAPPSFQDEAVTQDSHYIHAWGPDKAVSYLRRLWETRNP